MPAATGDARTLLTVGANGGSFRREMCCARPDLPIVAFEAHPDSHRALSANVARTAIEPINAELSDRGGIVRLLYYGDRDGSAQAGLGREVVAMRDVGTSPRTATCLRLDGFVEYRGVERIPLLNIDIEGSDLAVFTARPTCCRGARSTGFEFAAAKIATRVAMREVLEILDSYDLYRLCANGEPLPLERCDFKRHDAWVVQNVEASLQQ